MFAFQIHSLVNRCKSRGGAFVFTHTFHSDGAVSGVTTRSPAMGKTIQTCPNFIQPKLEVDSLVWKITGTSITPIRKTCQKPKTKKKETRPPKHPQIHCLPKAIASRCLAQCLAEQRCAPGPAALAAPPRPSSGVRAPRPGPRRKGERSSAQDTSDGWEFHMGAAPTHGSSLQEKGKPQGFDKCQGFWTNWSVVVTVIEIGWDSKIECYQEHGSS